MSTTKYTKWTDYPRTRLRFYTKRQVGIMIEFVVQLEYNLQPEHYAEDDFTPVARFDHDITGPHDVRNEGLHMDVLDLGPRKFEVYRNFPPKALDKCPDYAEKVLLKYHDQLVSAFERRNGLD
jgi:hypothetical protein